MIYLPATRNSRVLTVKLHQVDSIAHSKGFRRNRVYRVIGEDLIANPRRGALLVVQHRGRIEGFYPDQLRVRSRNARRA